MKKPGTYFNLTLLIAVALLLITGCSTRQDTPFTEDDLTIVFPSKKADDVSVSITLCRKADKDTDERIGEGTVFSILENAVVRAYVDIENRYAYGDRELMFHLDWIGPDESSFYLKQIIIPPHDSAPTINSSISISPEIRDPGAYSLKVYFFRELIAEKKFEILPELEVDLADENALSATIILYRKESKKTGKRIGEGTTFTIKKKEQVRALIELENRFFYGEQELIFKIDWIGPDGASFYDKRINLFPGDSTSSLTSSVSISPGKREPGEYILRISLFEKVIAEQKFELQN